MCSLFTLNRAPTRMVMFPKRTCSSMARLHLLHCFSLINVFACFGSSIGIFHAVYLVRYPCNCCDRSKHCAFRIRVSLFAVSRNEFDNLSARLVAQENMLGNAQPRIASLEYMGSDLQSRISLLETRLDKLDAARPGRVRQRALLLEDEAETQAAPAAPSHRGPGALPAPVPAKGFSHGQITAMATLPGSMSLPATLPDDSSIILSDQTQEHAEA